MFSDPCGVWLAFRTGDADQVYCNAMQCEQMPYLWPIHSRFEEIRGYHPLPKRAPGRCVGLLWANTGRFKRGSDRHDPAGEREVKVSFGAVSPRWLIYLRGHSIRPHRGEPEICGQARAREVKVGFRLLSRRGALAVHWADICLSAPWRQWVLAQKGSQLQQQPRQLLTKATISRALKDFRYSRCGLGRRWAGW